MCKSFSANDLSNWRSNDWLGIRFIALHVVFIFAAPLCIIFNRVTEKYPFYFAFELILPSSHVREMYAIHLVILVPMFLSILCVLEFNRFASLTYLFALFSVHTILACSK